MFAWLGAQMARFQRASTEPIGFEPMGSNFFGQGVGNQPSDETLLQENLGVADIATRAIANRISSLDPLVKVSVTSEAGTQEDETLDDHPLKLLLDNPHPDFTRVQMLRLAAQYIVTVGKAFWLKVGSGMGVPVELHPMPAQNVFPRWEGGYITGYRVLNGQGTYVDLPRDVVVRFALPDPEDPYFTEGYLAPQGTVVDGNKFAEQHLRSHFQNDATPKTALEAGENAEDFSDASWRNYTQGWQTSYHRRLGTQNGTPAKLPTGWTLKELSLQTGQEMVPLLEFWERQILKNFGVPRSILGEVVSGDRSSAETNQFVFDQHTIAPLARILEDALTQQLAVDFDERLFVQFDGFVSEDKTFNLAQESQDLTLKVRSAQQILRDRGADPEDASWGEMPVGKLGEVPYTGEDDFAPVQDVPGAFPPAEEEAEDPEEDEERSRAARARFWSKEEGWRRIINWERKYVPAFTRSIRDILQRQRDSVLAKLQDRSDRSRAEFEDIFSTEDWISLFQRTTEPLREAIFLDVLNTTLPSLGFDMEDFIFSDAMRKVIHDQGARMIRQVNETTGRRLAAALEPKQAQTIAGQLEAGVGAGESLEELTNRVLDVFKVRRQEARTIARTETGKAQSRAELESYKLADVEFKTWHTSLDDAVRDSHRIEGQRVPVGENFTLDDGEQAANPRVGANGGELSARNSINCRCFTTTTEQT